jgi:hypothetical protein
MNPFYGAEMSEANKMLPKYIEFLKRNACMSIRKIVLKENPTISIRATMSTQKFSHLQ